MIAYFKNLFVDTWTNTEKSSIESNAVFQQKFVDIKTLLILIYIPVALSIVKYYGDIDFVLSYTNTATPGFAASAYHLLHHSDLGIFYQKLWWVFIIALFYMIVPMLIVKLLFKQKLSDYGFTFNNVQRDYPLYILLLLIMFPIVYFASMTASFQSRYPMFKPATGQLLGVFTWWELAYFIQFVALEFFFRGFILHGTKNRFGFYSIFISVIPYCMIHFGKPFAETIAAIFAGVMLGTLSLKSRSVFLGILIHFTVAITMDLFALYHEGLLR
jgi:CAAX protease family protein